MKKVILLISLMILCFGIIPLNTKADVAGLVPCRESTKFNQRLQNSVKKLKNRLSKYESKTPPAIALEQQIQKTETRFSKYSRAGLLCGSDGLPHLITDGRWNRASDFFFPGLLFLYITGWIGWVGRGYLLAVAETNKPTEKEIILDVPLAIKFISSGFIWPLAAWQELSSGRFLTPDDEISVSPR